ncbi:MAG: 1,4-dihydroxy-2-naphthoate octaprenyltransferase, partial [Flavobacteriales bacterium]
MSSIIVGSSLAFENSRWSAVGPHWGQVTLLALLTATLLQILSNLANDLGDHQHGTDNAERVGPQRTVQSGAISANAMKRAMAICGTLALISGIALILVAFGLSVNTLVFLFFGLLAIAAATYYTFGPKPYGYAGLGDISVFVFFGLLGVIGTHYLHREFFETSVILPAIAFGLLSVGVLNLNNMRDIANDAASGKRTLVVRMGSATAKVYHTALVLGGIGCLVVYSLMRPDSPLQWIYLPVLLFFL